MAPIIQNQISMTDIRRKQAKQSAETSTRILDGAQKLFSNNGFEGVSMRAIAAEAQVNLASIVYYFESKEGLYFAVIDRYAEDILELRRRAVAKADKNPSLEGYVRAFMEPAFQILLDSKYGGCEFARLLWRLPHEPKFIQERMTPKYVTPIYELYVTCIKKLYPDVSIIYIQSIMHIARSLFFSTLGRSASSNIWPCEALSSDYEEVLNRMVKSLCSALESMLK